MASYISTLWRSLTGRSRPTFNEADFLDALRPRAVLRTPKRLPTTPTRSHLPASRPMPKEDGKKSKQCPHCRKTIYLELPSGRISKPATTRPTAKGKGKGKGRGKRWVSVSDSYKVEDLSPVLYEGDMGNGGCSRGDGVLKLGKAKKGKAGRGRTPARKGNKRSASPSRSPDRSVIRCFPLSD